MSEYLSKEEIKQWRSSLEKITLEEFAARLGKKLEEEKHTNDLVDIVLKGKPIVSTSDDWMQTKGERINSIAERSFEREREIAPSPFTLGHLKSEDLKALKEDAAKTPKKTAKKAAKVKDEIHSAETKKAVKKTTAKKPAVKAKVQPKQETVENDTLRDEVRIVFKKALTDREQKVFDHFAQNSGKIVYAKDLAALLDLPRDYVYKYIKNLRAKIDGDNLQNADKGGFILHV